MIHLELLTLKSPKQALEQIASLEATRRRYAILHIEEAMSTGTHHGQRDEYEDVHQILETVVKDTVRALDLEGTITRYISLQKERLTTIKAIQESQI
ncbi:hypothetical protein BWQ96_06472 [Gracilariopsis chorda]|uniref:Uncharacterized protein n=1 Tax=Gracilariopsis chorda TaxID=448386 RepID=A0A2V3INZ9_9FLOR|nr:hypothetical protein BWQ96_06472 [Gracilariopsis chorda]|eukprot:PXF43779.1 hypothetical protein BWQ96_06472 [Gracilariopsis chorda]